MGVIFSKTQDEPEEALLKAIKSGDTSEVLKLLETGADVNRRFWREFQIRGCHSHLLRCLEAGDNVNELLSNDDYYRIEFLIKPEELVFSLSLKGYTPLMMAATTKHVNSVKILLDSGADVNQTNELGETAVFYAVRKGCYDNLQLLLEEGADVNNVNKEGSTALHAAVNCNRFRIRCSHQLKCIQKLLKAGAHVNKYDKKGNDALSYLLYYATVECEHEDRICNEMQVSMLYGAGEFGIPRDEVDETSKRGGLCCLKNSCREAIRAHMLNLDKHSNLFTRIPRLELPSQLTRYLLYGTSVENEHLCSSHS